MEGGRKGVFALVRMHVPLVVEDRKTKISRHIANNVWDYVVENHGKWRTRHVKPLFITHRDMQEDTSLIVKARDPDALADFITKHIAPMPSLRGIWVLNMTKIRIVRLPRDRPSDLRRFTVTIDAMPKFIDAIYDRICSMKPSNDIIITYITQTFESFHASIMVSVLARSTNHIQSFVENNIKVLEGVEDADITYISKTLRLVSREEWLKDVGAFLVSPGRERMKKLEVDDDSLFAAC